jgi:hypothetical protein
MNIEEISSINNLVGGVKSLTSLLCEINLVKNSDRDERYYKEYEKILNTEIGDVGSIVRPFLFLSEVKDILDNAMSIHTDLCGKYSEKFGKGIDA